MADGLNQVGAKFDIGGSVATIGGEAGREGTHAALMYASSIVFSMHWWISLHKPSYHWAAAPNALRKGSATGSPWTCKYMKHLHY